MSLAGYGLAWGLRLELDGQQPDSHNRTRSKLRDILGQTFSDLITLIFINLNFCWTTHFIFFWEKENNVENLKDK